MVRPLLRASAAIAFAAFLAPTAPTAAPAPGLAYDEVVRVIVNESPPPPGGFQADLAAARAATPSPLAQAPKPARRPGLGSIAGAILSGNPNAIGNAAASEALGSAVQASLQRTMSGAFAPLATMVSEFLQPHIMHYSYWNGWERVDDLGAQTATIRKCDIGQTVQLDLAKRTYSVSGAQTSASSAAPAPAPSVGRNRTSGPPQEPGTANATLTLTTRTLPTQRIENEPTSGYETTTTFTMSNATGSCRNGSGTIQSVEYLPTITRPSVTACPIRSSALPERPTEVVAPPAGGCRPTFSATNNGPVPPSGRLTLYSLVRLSAVGASPAPQASGGALGFLTERGNLRTLGQADAALFEIPQGFTKVP
ncbi:MAG TPA: hypothetical protein VE591_15140 [Candidatus Acidoferrum sp.]|nr:hypothetical protein [Candidatus Acidoferrum sp.]